MESAFLRYVRYTFKRWKGFQAAIAEGMGGPYAEEKEVWLVTEVENYFKRYSNVISDDIAEYLGAMIENEFDTYFEDGSLQEVSHNFCAAFKLSLENPDAEIFKFDDSEPDILTNQTTAIVQHEQIPCQQMQELKIKETVHNDAEEDGWTTVTKKNKKGK